MRVKHQSCVSYAKDLKMDYNDYDIEVRKARVKARLDAAIEESTLSGEDGIRRERRVWPYVAGIISAAAAVVLAVVLNVVPRSEDETVNWVEVLTAYGEKKSVLLPDGTVIWLHNESRLLYPSEFARIQKPGFERVHRPHTSGVHIRRSVRGGRKRQEASVHTVFQ